MEKKPEEDTVNECPDAFMDRTKGFQKALLPFRRRHSRISADSKISGPQILHRCHPTSCETEFRETGTG